MSRYNLERLGWANFETLSKVLLRELLGTGLSSFTGSADQGRDATFKGTASEFPSKTGPWVGNIVVQCKFRTWSTGGVSKVVSDLRSAIRHELEALIEKYNTEFDYYLFLTNAPLTAQVKNELRTSALTLGTIKDCGILAEADIEELLTGRHHIARSFPALLGNADLVSLVNWGITQRSAEYLKRIQADLNTFVVTEPYLKALETLKNRHFCVLTGPPKMGKTCTANALLVSYAAAGYSVHELRSQEDFYNSRSPDEKQIFLCDDVFGDIALKAAMRDEWTRQLNNLIGSLGSSQKLIWTARSYILKLAIESSRIKEERPELEIEETVTVAVDSLTISERAQILYNHARRANLPDPIRGYLRRSCFDIATHPAYAPESIRQLCSTGLFQVFEKTYDPEEVQKQVAAFLSEPGVAWKKAYGNAPLGERLLCLEVMANGGQIFYEQLRDQYIDLAQSYGPEIQSFDEAINCAEGSFLRRRVVWDSTIMVGFYHPTMRDLLGELLRSDPHIRRSYIKRLSLSELTLAVFPRESILEAHEDNRHRLQFDRPEDLEQIEGHLAEKLLPNCDLGGLVLLLSQIADATKSASPIGLSDGTGSQGGRLLAMLLELTVETACSSDFYVRNSRTPLSRWRVFFDRLADLLPRCRQDYIPSYVGELLDNLLEYESVDFWGLVSALERIVPTIVRRRVDQSKREMCTDRLSRCIKEGISFVEAHDLEDDFALRRKLHAEFSNIIEESNDYLGLFRDEEVDGLSELEGYLESYSPSPPEPDYIEAEVVSRTPDANSRESVVEMFRDL